MYRLFWKKKIKNGFQDVFIAKSLIPPHPDSDGTNKSCNFVEKRVNTLSSTGRERSLQMGGRGIESPPSLPPSLRARLYRGKSRGEGGKPIKTQ